MAGTTVTFGVILDGPHMIRVEGVEQWVTRVIEIWPNGDGTVRRHEAKAFTFWSKEDSQAKAQAYLNRTYKRA